MKKFMSNKNALYKQCFKDIINIIILFVIFLFVILKITKFKNIYGSVIDWNAQHWTFAEYFRKLFYNTFNLFPSFAFNIGAGQNIYNFSYYGFLNPIILISYFLPFVKMMDYVIISSIIGILISIVLFYKWLRNHNFNRNITFLVSIIFLCASPLIFHSHRHIMFVNYMPFLLMGLFSIDNYFKNGKRLSLILSVFLICMSSYYFAISSLVVLIIYAINCFLKKEKDINLKKFFIEGIKFLIPIFIGILMASILIFPTFHTILSGRGEHHNISINLKDILLPRISLDYLLYSTYSIGLTSIIIFAIIYIISSKKRENVFIGIILLIILFFPLITYVLNGTLYINSKILIPFLPLCCYIIAVFLEDLFNNKVNILKVFIPVIIISVLACFTLDWSNNKNYIIDIILVIIAILIYYLKKTKIFLYLILVILSINNVTKSNDKDTLFTNEDYNYIFNENIENLFDETLKNDNEICRSSNLVEPLITSNKVYNYNYYSTSSYSSIYNFKYRDFYTNNFNNQFCYRNYLMLTDVNSILWNTYMGVKYVVTDENIPIGYEKVKEIDKFGLYKNNNVLPIGYSRDKLMSKKEYESLKYPYNVEALLNYTIIDKDIDSDYKTKIQDLNLEFNNNKNKDLDVKKENNHYKITANNDTKAILPLNEVLNNKILIISFKMNYEQENEDTSITINGVKNTLTCSSWKYKNKNYDFNYVISSDKDIKELEVEFTKGYYDISDINLYLMDYENIKEINSQIDSLKINKEKTKGDIIEGEITVDKDGYFSLSVPYDKGFKIYVNGKKIDYELVNTSFIGFPLEKGDYNIKIVYTAPLKNASLILSCIGIVLFIIVFVLDHRKLRIKNLT